LEKRASEGGDKRTLRPPLTNKDKKPRQKKGKF